MGTLIIVIVALGIVGGIIQGTINAKKNKDEKQSRYAQTFAPLKIEDYYIPDFTLSREDQNFSIGFDKAEKKILFFSKNNKKYAYDYSDILRCEIDMDGETHSQTSTSSAVGRAALGGILTGGVGAIIGGTTGKRTQKETVSSMILKIVVNDTANPIFKITFFKNAKAIKKGGIFYKEKYAVIEKWDAIVSGLIRSAAPVEKAASAKSASAQLSELFDLKQKGAISEEEFAAHKARLLS